jgi:hypothetical protein
MPAIGTQVQSRGQEVLSLVSTASSQSHMLCVRGGGLQMKYPPVQIIVEYDSRGSRASKTFTDHYEARRFYASKLKAGKHPSVHRDKQDKDQ